MTGLIGYALALFVMGQGDQVSESQIIKSNTIYERYYTGTLCSFPEFYSVGNKPIRECTQGIGNDRTDDFYIVFDFKNQTWERYRKIQLLRLYIKQ